MMLATHHTNNYVDNLHQFKTETIFTVHQGNTQWQPTEIRHLREIPKSHYLEILNLFLLSKVSVHYQQLYPVQSSQHQLEFAY